MPIRPTPAAALVPALLLVACPAAPDDDDDTPAWPDVPLHDFDAAAPWFGCPDESDFPDEVVVADVFDREPQRFGDANLRDVEARVTLPTGDFAQVGLWFQLDCPGGSGSCDDWDRAGSLSVALDADAPPEAREWVEVLRHVTPYNRGMCQFVDVTPLLPLLQGDRLFGSHIDTWVDPAWLVTARLVYTPGRPTTRRVINVWGHRSIAVGDLDPAASVDAQVEPVTVAIPASARRVRAHLVTTGHGFGYSGNCAEFCGMEHAVVVNGEEHTWSGWRDDCDENPVSPQDGTWLYPRNGWCPGAVAVGRVLNVLESVTPGQDATIDLDIRLANGFQYEDTSGADGAPFTRVSLKLYVEE